MKKGIKKLALAYTVIVCICITVVSLIAANTFNFLGIYLPYGNTIAGSISLVFLIAITSYLAILCSAKIFALFTSVTDHRSIAKWATGFYTFLISGQFILTSAELWLLSPTEEASHILMRAGANSILTIVLFHFLSLKLLKKEMTLEN